MASSKTFVLGLSGSAMLSIVVFGFLVKGMEGFPERLPAPVYKLYAATYDKSPFLSQKCFTDTNGSGLQTRDIKEGKLCTMGAASVRKPQFLVWGDSHAAAMAPAISMAAFKGGVSGLFVGRASCPPLPEAEFGPEKSVKRCEGYNNAVLQFIEKEETPFVFLVGYWPKYVHRAELPGEGIYFNDAVAPPSTDWSAPVLASLRKTIAKLDKQGTRVILVMDVPEMGRDVPEALARAKMTGSSLNIAPSLAYTNRRQALARQILALSAVESGSLLVDPMQSLCDRTKCYSMINGKVLYQDGDHLSRQGAEFLSPIFNSVFSVIRRESLTIAGGGS